MVDILDATKNLIDGWMPISFLLLMIGVIISTLVYIIGTLLQNDKIKAWAKMEVFEVFYSALLLGIAIVAVTVANNTVTELVAPSAAGGIGGLAISPDPFAREICSQTTTISQYQLPAFRDIPYCHIRLGMYFLNEIFTETSRVGADTYLSYLITSTLADFAVNIEFVFEKAGFFTYNPWRGFFVVGNMLKQSVFDFSTKIMLIVKFQEIALAFIATAFFPVVFVVGVTLRTFAFTRRLGGLLMALAVALFFIFPMFYALGALVVNQIKISVINDPLAKDEHGNSYSFSNPPPFGGRMYVRGEVPVFGDAKFDLGKASQEIKQLGQRRTGIFDVVENFFKEDKKAFSPRTNIANPSSGEDDKIERELKEVEKKTESMLSKWTKKVWYDNFVLVAFERGGPMDILARLAFFSVFFSFIGLMGTIAAIRSLSTVFGGDIEIAGLTQLI